MIKGNRIYFISFDGYIVVTKSYTLGRLSYYEDSVDTIFNKFLTFNTYEDAYAFIKKINVHLNNTLKNNNLEIFNTENPSEIYRAINSLFVNDYPLFFYIMFDILKKYNRQCAYLYDFSAYANSMTFRYLSPKSN